MFVYILKDLDEISNLEMNLLSAVIQLPPFLNSYRIYITVLFILFSLYLTRFVPLRSVLQRDLNQTCMD